MCVRLSICMIIIMLLVMNQAKAALPMEQILKTMETVRNSCIKKTNADSKLVAGIQKGQFPDDKSLKCYTLCALKTMRSFKNGHIDLNMLGKQIDLLMSQDIAVPMKVVADMCGKKPPASDDCETAIQFVKCNYEADADNFLFP